MLFKGNAVQYEKPSPGAYAAVCFRCIDLGTQEVLYKGQTKHMPKMIISWELGEKMKDGKQFTVSAQFTKSLSEKAALRAALEGWRGKAFTQEEIDTFDEKKILGRGCLLNLVESEDGKYINVKTVSGLPKGMAAHTLVNPVVSFSLDHSEFSQEVFDGLHDKIKAKIMGSPEWAKLKGIEPDTHHTEAPPQESEESVPF